MNSPAIHVLVVEDNPDDVLFLKGALDRLDIRCHISFAVNGGEAVDFLSSKLRNPSPDPQEPALPTHILLDLKLPLKPGLEVLEWIRCQPGLSEIPVVIFTSSQENSDVDRATKLLIDSFRVKPVGIDEYQRVVADKVLETALGIARLPLRNPVDCHPDTAFECGFPLNKVSQGTHAEQIRTAKKLVHWLVQTSSSLRNGGYCATYWLRNTIEAKTAE